MMRRYEVVSVLAPTLTEDEVEQAIASFRKAAEDKGATIVDVDEWGKRRLAYPIKKHSEGVYTVMTIEEPAADAVRELERRFKVTDSVIRFLSVRVDLDLKRVEKVKTARQQKRQRTLRRRAEKRAPESAEEQSDG